MNDLHGRNALVTGASGGIGAHIARALAREGVNVVASGRRQDALNSVADELRAMGVRAETVSADLGDVTQAQALIERSEAALGPIDIVVNNAGLESASAFVDNTPQELMTMIAVNLTAPLLLTHRAVPGMLARGRGHVVFIASLAGKIGPAYQQPYAATKAGLIGLTQSLRAEYRGAPVGFSVVCPGFVAGDGMYQRMVEQGVRSNRVMGETSVERIAAKVVDAIRRDLPDVVESGRPIRPLLALAQVAPRLAERLVDRVGPTEMFRQVAADRARAD